MIESRASGSCAGIYSACSANEYVIEAALRRAKDNGEYVLIEATANQVNQDGGYTGMVPASFRDFVHSVALRVGFPGGRIILGGDHLGPLTWRKSSSASAMGKSRELVRQYVLAGFTKIHLDTSMYLGDDDRSKKLDDRVIADRAADLASVAEEAYGELEQRDPNAERPVYIVGSEVPIPGGSRGEEAGLSVTAPEDFESTLDIFGRTFRARGLDEAWRRVVGFVVQPGVEFGDESVHQYDREAARSLTLALGKHPGLVFEGHSTDYQTARALRQMVEDGIAILKVGPGLTFALREALVALGLIEEELLADGSEEKSRFAQILEERMVSEPDNWKDHYRGDPAALRIARRYSYSDRCRYYLPDPAVRQAIGRLISNLENRSIPTTVLSQYMPSQYRKIMEGDLRNGARELILDRIGDCIDDYRRATVPSDRAAARDGRA